MSDVKELLRTAIGNRQPEIPELDAVLRSTARRRRRERIVAGVLAVVLTAGLATGLALLVGRSGTGGGPSEGVDVVGPTSVVYIPSESMTPTLQVGDSVLVDEGAYKATGGVPERGDLIAFQAPVQGVPGADPGPTETFVKRVVGLPGDEVEQRRGDVYVNGRPFPMPSTPEPDHRTVGPFRVQAGDLFVLGDNLANSNDSRFALGQIPLETVIGKVVQILSPDDRRATVGPPRAPAVPGPAKSDG